MRHFIKLGFFALCQADQPEPDLASQLLAKDDDCMSGEEGQCSLNALQHQGLQLADGCYETGQYYYPNMGQRTQAKSAADCQKRCASNHECAHFSYWPDGGCHIQGQYAGAHHASRRYGQVISGPPTCEVDDAPTHEQVAAATTSGSAACSAVPGCAKLKIAGDCCPTAAGMFLGCCPDSMVPHPTAPPPRVMDGRKLMTLYHQTSPEACQGILAEGFRIGHGGWCGDAIYFALSPEATKTKAITPHSGIGCMLEVTVDIGEKQKFPCCRLCGGKKNEHVYWTEQSLKAGGYDSIEINPGDGPEIVIYNNNRVVTMKEIPFKTEWTPHRLSYKE